MAFLDAHAALAFAALGDADALANLIASLEALAELKTAITDCSCVYRSTGFPLTLRITSPSLMPAFWAGPSSIRSRRRAGWRC